jgi:IS5 family transposase
MTPIVQADIDKRYQKLAQKKDFLIRLNKLIPWEEFRPVLNQVREKPRKSNAGRPPLDVILLFKLLVLQKLFNISDEELEYQVIDRFSFMEFLGLSLADEVPDATTVWLFRQQLTNAGLVTKLFDQFESYLQGHGYQAQGGQILDATIVPVPKQHFSKEEKEQLDKGEMPKEWKENPHRRSQRDTDANWTKKNNVSHFGYKDHISVDVEYGFVRGYSVSDAAMHDSQALPDILDEDNEGEEVWADSAYRSALIEWFLALLNWCSQIHEKGYRNHPLTEQQKEKNREKSKTRAKVEHVFGVWVNEMGGKLLRSIGLERAKTNLGLRNLVYNLKRYVYLESRAAATIVR